LKKEIQEFLLLYENNNLDFKLILDQKTFNIENLEIKNEATPVTKPTKRGGVYFSDSTTYMIKAVVSDLTVKQYLSQAMLGPNTEFQDIIIQTSFRKNDNISTIELITNLTSSMETSNKIKLNFILKDAILK
tara:strand:- start:10930 stop:11325 length:396 start_codon:yes stop_codon:yes gene_type:complete